jgi:hypothetical protein
LTIDFSKVGALSSPVVIRNDQLTSQVFYWTPIVGLSLPVDIEGNTIKVFDVQICAVTVQG